MKVLEGPPFSDARNLSEGEKMPGKPFKTDIVTPHAELAGSRSALTCVMFHDRDGIRQKTWTE
jgi:hypothetical protein